MQPLSPTPPLVLASSSPRRQELLHYLGLSFLIDPSSIDETPVPGIAPSDLAEALARAKTADVATRHPQAVVIGADTLVDLDGQVLNKPRDTDDARRMLHLLGGRRHQVHSGLAVWRAGTIRSRIVTSTVSMRPLDAVTIDAYVATGEPLDKAGGYAAQGEGAAMIASIDGSWLAVVGLPLLAVRTMLLEAGMAVPASLDLLERLDRNEA